MSAKKPSTTAAAASSSAEVIFNNDYLLSEILTRLPAKSLITFKSVSKHWHSLISEASFRHLHARRHRRPQTSFLLRSSGSQWFHFNPTRKNLVPFNFNFDQLKIIQSCNGLLLLEIGSGYTNRVYYVYNPTTGESRNLLLPNNENAKFLCLFLAFDPLKSPHYKAICLRVSKTTSLDFHITFYYYIEVYDSETHQWKRDDKPYKMLPHVLPCRPWVYSHNFTYSLTSTGGLICFDIENFTFGDQYWVDFEAGTRITESFGHVHIIPRDYDFVVPLVREITEKNGELSSEPLFDFDVTAEAATNPIKVSYLGVIRGEREESSLVFHIPGKIIAYRFYESRIEELLDLSTQSFYVDGILQFGYDSSFQFVESLAPV